MSDLPSDVLTREQRFYRLIQRLLEDDFGCFVTQQTTGVQGVGYADVLGARDIGGEYDSGVEVIAVEVKLSTRNFGKSLGQAHGYSLFANKSYLAVPFTRSDSFTSEQRDEAAHLGVGLIRISGWKKKRSQEVLTPSSSEPIEALRLKALSRMGYYQCAICRTMIGPPNDSDYTTRVKAAKLHGKTLYFGRQIRDERKVRRLLFMNRREEAVQRTTFVCSDCIGRLIPEG